MQFAVDENNTRIKPLFSGQKATCPFCNSSLIAKCGEIYIWHWQHARDRQCDPWQEHETDWHRKWKASFPAGCQEIIITKDNQKHIADVQTKAGIIIEFQNSSISTHTIRDREIFYENMIWIINAQSFKEHFDLRSVVSSQLRKIESYATDELSSIAADHEATNKHIQSSIDSNKKMAEEKFNAIKAKNKSLDFLTAMLPEFDNYAAQIIEIWAVKNFYLDFNTKAITSQIGTEIKAKLQEQATAIDNLHIDLKIKKGQLEFIEKLESISIGDSIYKLVTYDQLTLKHINIARAITKASRKTFFPEIISFKTAIDFDSYKHKQDKFDFVIDPSTAVHTITTAIEGLEKTILDAAESLGGIKNEIRSLLLEALQRTVETIQNEITTLENEWEMLIKESSRLSEKKYRIIAQHENDLTDSKKEIQRAKNDQRFKIMKERKGLYTFEWKHERKSWQAADATIYFDTGEGHLFRRVSKSLVRKVSIDEFLSEHTDSQ